MRRTGIELIGDAPWGTHFCQFYQTRQDLIDILVPYFRQGLLDNEFCMWITSEPLNVDDARKALNAVVPDLDDRLKKGQIEILDYSEWYTRSGTFQADKVLQGWVDKLTSALHKGYEGLRLTGNTFWLEKADWARFTDYEAIVNNVINRYRMMAVCTYSLNRCGVTEVIDVVNNHQFALIKKAGNWEIIESNKHKKISTALQEGEFRYRIVADNTYDFEFWINPEGRFLYASPASKRIYGRDPSGFLADPALRRNTIHPDDLAIFDRHVADEETKWIPGETEYRIVYPDGTHRWIAHACLPVFDEQGQYMGIRGSNRDITERKRAEEALRKLNAQLEQRVIEQTSEIQRKSAYNRTLIEASLDPLVTIGRDGKITDVNAATEAATGYRREELIGTDFSTYFTDPGKARAGYEQVYREGLVRDYPLEICHRDGHTIPVLYNASVYRDEAGNVTGVFAAARDITERKKAEAALKELNETLEQRVAERTEALRESEARLATVFRASPTGIFITRLNDGVYLDVNEAYLRITGYSRAETIGHTAVELNLWVNPADRGRLVDLLREGERIETGEIRFRRKSGEIVDLLVSALPLQRGGESCILGTLIDITGRKKAEESLQKSEEGLRQARDLLETVTLGSDVMIATVDRNYRYTYFNKEHHEEIKRLMGKESTIGMSLMDVLTDIPDQRKLAIALWDSALNGETIVQTMMFGEPGRYRKWYKTRHTPIRDADGVVTGAGEVTTDITEIMQAEEEVKRHTEELRVRNEELTRFNRAMVDRELRMIELKNEINELCVQSGQKKRYPLGFEKKDESRPDD